MHRSPARFLLPLFALACESGRGAPSDDRGATSSGQPTGSHDTTAVDSGSLASSTEATTSLTSGTTSAGYTSTLSAEDTADDDKLDLQSGYDCSGYDVYHDAYFVLDSNEEVANVAIYECIMGGLTFAYGVTDLTPLVNLQSVGQLVIETPDILSFDGLDNLRHVNGSLSLGTYFPDSGCYGAGVTTLGPLASLEHIGELFICNNLNLTSLAELGMALTGDVPGPISITSIPNLESLAGFEGLTSVGGNLGLVDFPLVPDVQPLANLTSVDELFVLGDLDALGSLEGLEQLTHVGGIYIGYNGQLTTLAGFDNLMDVTWDLEIKNNPMLPQEAAEAWAANIDVGRSISICNNLGGPPC